MEKARYGLKLRTNGLLLAGLALFLLPAASVVADEVAELVKNLNPPKRFADHVPNFKVEREVFVFHHADGKNLTGPGRALPETLWVVRDGERVIAFVRRFASVAEGIRLFGSDPAKMKTKLVMPQGRLHYDTEQGAIFHTGVGEIPPEADYVFSGGGKTLILTRSHEWEFTSGGNLHLRKQTNTYTFRVDPVTGYTVDAKIHVQRRDKDGIPEQNMYVAKAAMPGVFDPWPQHKVYQRAVYTPGGRSGYEGFFNSMPSIDQAERIGNSRGGFTLRDGGFIAFLRDSVGWSAAITRSGGGVSARMPNCNAHNVWSQKVTIPSDRIFHQRMVFLPPEITERIEKEMVVYKKGEKAVQLRIGTKETFEDQPLPIDLDVRGIYQTAGGLKLSGKAFSGPNALTWTGTLWPQIPQVVLEQRSKFRLEAMIKVEGQGATAWITGKTYEWSPHNNPVWYHELETQKVKPEDGWKKVWFEMETPDWDPFIDLKYHAEGGTAYMDDFSLLKMGESNSTSISLRPIPSSTTVKSGLYPDWKGTGTWLLPVPGAPAEVRRSVDGRLGLPLGEAPSNASPSPEVISP